MAGILLITHEGLGDALIASARHILGQSKVRVASLGFHTDDSADQLLTDAQVALITVDDGQGVLILTDMFGATPSNVARKLLEPGRINAIAGVNLPMLMRAITYATLPVDEMAEKALAGCLTGIIKLDRDPC